MYDVIKGRSISWNLLTWSPGYIRGYRKRSRCGLWTPWQQKCQRNGKCCTSPCEAGDRCYKTATTQQSNSRLSPDQRTQPWSEDQSSGLMNAAASVSSLSERADFPVRHTALLTEPLNASLALRAAAPDTHMWPSCNITPQWTQASAHLDTISCFQLCRLFFFFFF